ncbi:hypothetical protein [Paraburkholderia sp. Tr-20389]|uniref:hypothetical protein n=1 Tax=Paraburkholderia sp. Tr-20389 TaxID=2703903 RepID=UPI00197E58DA
MRVGLARALMKNADVLSMDEAFSALDPLIRCDLQDLLLELQTELKKTIIFIIHDIDEAMKLGSRIAIMKDREVACPLCAGLMALLAEAGRPVVPVTPCADQWLCTFSSPSARWTACSPLFSLSTS